MLELGIPRPTLETKQRLFSDEIAIFNEYSGIIAYRGKKYPDLSFMANSTPTTTQGSTVVYVCLLEDGRNYVNCKLDIGQPVRAVITPTDPSTLYFDAEECAHKITDYLRRASEIEITAVGCDKAYDLFAGLVASCADYCGCGTDISSDIRENSSTEAISHSMPSFVGLDSTFIAAAIPILSLMYRRLSALAGFNFRLSLSHSLPCLGFSAKMCVYHADEMRKTLPEEIPEFAFLNECAKKSGLVIVAKRIEIEPENDADVHDELFRLAVAICTQKCDPTGLLRDDEWRRLAEFTASDIIEDINGKY